MPRRRTDVADSDFEELLDGARRRDPACLRTLHDAVVRKVGAYLRANRAADPAGATNEVLFRALTNLHRFEGDADRFRAWVLTIAHHLLIDERRARSRRPSEVPLPDDAEVEAADDPVAVVELSEATERRAGRAGRACRTCSARSSPCAGSGACRWPTSPGSSTAGSAR